MSDHQRINPLALNIQRQVAAPKCRRISGFTNLKLNSTAELIRAISYSKINGIVFTMPFLITPITQIRRFAYNGNGESFFAEYER